MENNALVLLWRGKKLPDYLVQKIAEILFIDGICIPEMLTVKYMDEKSIAQCLVKETSTAFVDLKEMPEEPKNEAVKNAIIYIGDKFENSLQSHDLRSFSIEITTEYLFSGDFGVIDENLKTAVEILATTKPLAIPRSFAKKYGFDRNVLLIIKKLYKRES